jgi:BlaI family transcriptional regulator, penicillinase repressor
MGASFTGRELDIMAVLWETGSATVREVQEGLEPDLAYTTVLTILRTLEAKGHLRHEPEGRAHRYYPVVKRDEAGATALRQLVSKIFAGSPEALLTQLVSDDDLSGRDLLRLRELLDERLREEGEG